MNPRSAKRAEFAQKGLCTACGRKREDKLYKTCESCRYTKAASERARADERLQARRRLAEQRRKTGNCTRCGNKREDTDYWMCQACRQYLADAQVRSRARRKYLKEYPSAAGTGTGMFRRKYRQEISRQQRDINPPSQGE